MKRGREILERSSTAFLLALVVTTVSCGLSQKTLPVSEGQVQASADGTAIRLDGEWLLYPEGKTEPLLQHVPAVWNDVLPAWSAGTYRLRINGLKTGSLYSLHFKGMNTSAEIIIDGESTGVWAKSGMEYIPRTYCFTAQSDSMELEVPLENHIQAFGGIWMPVWFGTAGAVERSVFLARAFDIFIFGFIIMMALYHFTLFVMRPGEKTTLYFALFCVITPIKSGLAGEQILAILFPILDGVLGMRLAYLFTILLPITFLAYLNSMFPRMRSRVVTGGLVALGIAQSAVSILAPVHIMQSGFVVYQVAILLSSVYVLYALVREIRLKTVDASLVLFGVLILMLATVNDVLHDQKIIITFYSIGFGLLLFLFDQAIVLGRVFTRSFNEVQDLNAHLEQRVAERTRELEHLTRVDSLTNLINRRYFWVLLEQEWDRWIRYGQNFCLVMIDLDHFKDLNDSMGHAVGDDALRNLGKLLQANVRKTDTVARYGGEEFCLILPGTRIDEAWTLMEKIRISLASEPLITLPAPTIKTLSYGVAQASGHKGPVDLLDASDKLMYRAKESGRNQGFAEVG